MILLAYGSTSYRKFMVFHDFARGWLEKLQKRYGLCKHCKLQYKPKIIDVFLEAGALGGSVRYRITGKAGGSRNRSKPMKIIGFFDEIMQKIWFKIWVGKMMKIFFIRNAGNNIPLSLKVFSVMPLAEFPRKTMIFSCVFMFSDHCRVSYSKYMLYAIALQKRVCFVRARSRK